MTSYAIFGLGKSGKATLEYLGDKAIYAWDDNPESRTPNSQPPTEWNWQEIDALILAPGIPLTHPKPHYIVEEARKHNVPIICDVELLYLDNPDAKFIGITGTNGKSTTTALLGHILQENGFDVAIGGNLGTPALQLGSHEYYVIEMSSYQLDLIDKTKFDIALWLNITPDHIDRHGDIEGYIKAKKNIFKNGNEIAIIGKDDEHSRKVAQKLPNKIEISKENEIAEFGNLPGKHNTQNINAAFEAAKYLGVEESKIISSIKSFPGLEHRIEFVASKDSVRFINDSKATNADSASCALECFDDIYWIVGGVPKEGGIDSLEKYFPKIKRAYLIGQSTEEFAEFLEGKVPYNKTDYMKNAVELALQDAEKGVVLLSPACASFDQYNNFEERGDEFKKLVLNYSHEN